MVKIRLKRFGAKKRPYYRVVVMDSRSPRQGRTIEELGHYHPVEVGENSIRIDKERFQYWIEKGARASDTVRLLLKKINVREAESNG